MNPIIVAALVVAAAAVIVAVLLMRRGGGAADELREMSDRLADSQAALAGRLAQMAEQATAAQAATAERLAAQERHIAEAVEQRLARLGQSVGQTLERNAQAAAVTLGDLTARLAVIDAAQTKITELSTQVVQLQDILSNKQARGAFGEVQLEALVSGILPPSAYAFQAPLGDGRRVDCLLHLPNPPGSIAIDAKFPLESWHALRQAKDDAARLVASRAFAAAILLHVRAIADKYIVPGQTAESALMFIPAEAVYAELHANFPEVVEKSYLSRVWIVSPTTLMATLNTVRAVLKDVRMREQAGLVQKEVRLLIDDVGRLDDRVGRLQRHFDQTSEDVRQIRISTDKVTKRGERIGELEVEDAATIALRAVPPTAPAALPPA
ncbi:DNA recombination protein RmuC [Stella humosa]|uniref:DNA recombination protein RmuC homolog n=2 Tax=Stella humosa TaxID=94 RepID=A0A3N1LIM5_9PROT|nr:DNA recombination protein RmuC [Stella humosa]